MTFTRENARTYSMMYPGTHCILTIRYSQRGNHRLRNRVTRPTWTNFHKTSGTKLLQLKLNRQESIQRPELLLPPREMCAFALTARLKIVMVDQTVKYVDFRWADGVMWVIDTSSMNFDRILAGVV